MSAFYHHYNPPEKVPMEVAGESFCLYRTGDPLASVLNRTEEFVIQTI